MDESKTVGIRIQRNPSLEWGKPDADKMAQSGAPVEVSIEIPRALIRLAKTYPAINWNDVIRHAVKEASN